MCSHHALAAAHNWIYRTNPLVKESCAKRPGCELALSPRHTAWQPMLTLTEHSGGNALRHFSRSLGEGDLSLKSLHAGEGPCATSACPRQRPTPSATDDIWCSYTDANEKPRTFALLGSARRTGQFAVLQLFEGGRAI